MFRTVRRKLIRLYVAAGAGTSGAQTAIGEGVRNWTVNGRGARQCQAVNGEAPLNLSRSSFSACRFARDLQAVPKQASSIGVERPIRGPAHPDVPGSAAICGDTSRRVTPEPRVRPRRPHQLRKTVLSTTCKVG